MGKQVVECLIEGGKASAGPPIGSSLGPLGMNLGQLIKDINAKTDSFKGMQVPVKITVDTDTKEYTITIGTPPASALIIKEAGVQKGAGNPLQDKIADVRIEQTIKIAKMKQDSLTGKTLKERVKEIIGTCNSMGIMVEGVSGKEAIQLVNQGKFDKKIADEKTELSAEELKELEMEKKRLEEEIKTRREEFMAKAKAVVAEMAGKEKSAIKHKLLELKIPLTIIQEVMPADDKAKPAAAPGGAAPATGAAKPAAGDAKKK
ncbi:50S ribosomal protein L11 [Candidatus Woesearchaeota archaeon]|nr:50S ribosomal protein L11 [Candidatus Woesearchaeota archaeon]